MTITLQDLIDEYGGNGFVVDDKGNGSAGPTWAVWDEDVLSICGDIPMARTFDEEIKEIARLVIEPAEDYGGDEMYVSPWIRDPEDKGSNPYMFRIIF